MAIVSPDVSSLGDRVTTTGTPTVTITAAKIKKPSPTQVIPNPLNSYASYTYSWSLWRLETVDYTALMEQTDVDKALSWEPSNSYVIAEDGGLFVSRRHPATLGLNYNIQDVDFITVPSLNNIGRGTNLLSGNATILEPYGVSLIDTLVAASWNGSSFTNYTDQPYMLQLDFHGYDDNGNQLADPSLRKRFPIRIIAIKLQVTPSGAEYKLSYVDYGSIAHHPEFDNLPEQKNVVAGTIGDFFTNLSGQMGLYYQKIKSDNNGEFADQMLFDVDPSIATSAINYNQGVPLQNSSPDGIGIDLSKQNFNIPAGASVIDIINKVLCQSDYFIKNQANLTTAPDGSTIPAQDAIFNAFKITAKTEIGDFDTFRNRYALKITYMIHQYPTWAGGHASLPNLADSTAYTMKAYNYIYTGKNSDILDFKLNFDLTYYSAILSYTDVVVSTMPSSSTGTDAKNAASSVTSLTANYNPSLLARAYPQLSPVPTVTPSKYAPVVYNQNITTGLASNPVGQKVADGLNSLYSHMTGDMIAIDLTINGDPTLIKQDAWLYVPSPTTSTNYNAWDTLGQSDFVARYGHARMDTGEMPVSLTVNTPLDLDTDITNRGLMYPAVSTSQAMFSGQYRIIKIDSKFSGGQFTQVLHMVRYMNQDMAKVFANTKTQGRN